MERYLSDTTVDSLKQRIAELEQENKQLKAEIKRLKSRGNAVYSLANQLSGSVDLGEMTKKLPPVIPEHKKWRADDFPKDWDPEQKAKAYLLTLWQDYPVSQSYFNNVRGGQAFYKFLIRHSLLKLLPNSFQLQLKKQIKS